MDKISSIVRGNSRVATSDLKASGAVRPGALSFGRPIGESTSGAESRFSTAEKAAALQAGLNEARKTTTKERIVADMADGFFMSRARQGEIPIGVPQVGEITGGGAQVQVPSEQLQASEGDAQEYVPRGSFVDVRA